MAIHVHGIGDPAMAIGSGASPIGGQSASSGAIDIGQPPDVIKNRQVHIALGLVVVISAAQIAGIVGKVGEIQRRDRAIDTEELHRGLGEVLIDDNVVALTPKTNAVVYICDVMIVARAAGAAVESAGAVAVGVITIVVIAVGLRVQKWAEVEGPGKVVLGTLAWSPGTIPRGNLGNACRGLFAVAALAWNPILERVCIAHKGDADLSLVGEANDGAARSPSLPQCGEEQTDEQSDDGDHYEEFDEGECRAMREANTATDHHANIP